MTFETVADGKARRTITIAGLRLDLPTRWPVERLLGASEQVLASLISMVGLIVFSRLLDVQSFGIVGGALGIALILQFIHDDLTVSPFVVVCPNPREDRGTVGDWLLWHFLVAGGLSVALFGAGLAFSSVQPAFADQIMLSAPILLGATIFSYVRRMHYHWESFGSLIVQTVLYGLIYAAGLLACWSWGWVSADNAAYVIALSYAVPGVIYCARNCLRANFHAGFLTRIHRSRELIASMGGGAAVWQSSYASALILLSVMANPVAVAIFTVTRTLERPIGLIISSVLDVDTSKAVRALANEGVRGLERVVGNAGLLLAAVTGLPIFLMLAFPALFLTLVYGQSYAGATFELQLRILVLVPLVISAPLMVGLTVLRDTVYLLRINLAGLIAGLAFLLGCYLFSTIDAAAANASLLVMQLTCVPFLLVRYRARIKALRQAGVTTP